jgi:hypothetical protein
MNGHDFPGMKLYGSGYGWWLWEDGLQGHGGAVPGFYAQMLFKDVDDGAYGLVMMMNIGCSLVPCDNEWFDKFFITIRELLLQEAEKLHLGSKEASSEATDYSADNPIYTSYSQGWWTYTNATYGFSFLVPPNWIVDDPCFSSSAVNTSIFWIST